MYAEVSDSFRYEETNLHLPTEQTSKLRPSLNTRYPPPTANDPAQWYATLNSVKGDSCALEVDGAAFYQQDSESEAEMEILDLPSSPRYCHHSIASLAIRQLSTASQDPLQTASQDLLPTEAEEHLGTVSVGQDGSGSEDQTTANWRMSWPTCNYLLSQFPASIEPLQRIKSQDL